MIKSLNSHRLAFNPLEKALVEAWERRMATGMTLEYILSGVTNRPDPVSERDREVAVTMIQWLGTPTGQSFLEEALGIDLRDQLRRVSQAKARLAQQDHTGAAALRYEKACTCYQTGGAQGD